MLVFFINLAIFVVSLTGILFLVLKKLPQVKALPQTRTKKIKTVRQGIMFVANKFRAAPAGLFAKKDIAKAPKIKKQKLDQGVLEKANDEADGDDYWKNIKEI